MDNHIQSHVSPDVAFVLRLPHGCISCALIGCSCRLEAHFFNCESSLILRFQVQHGQQIVARRLNKGKAFTLKKMRPIPIIREPC